MRFAITRSVAFLDDRGGRRLRGDAFAIVTTDGDLYRVDK